MFLFCQSKLNEYSDLEVVCVFWEFLERSE